MLFGLTVFMNKSRFKWCDCHEGIQHIEDVAIAAKIMVNFVCHISAVIECLM